MRLIRTHAVHHDAVGARRVIKELGCWWNLSSQLINNGPKWCIMIERTPSLFLVASCPPAQASFSTSQCARAGVQHPPYQTSWRFALAAISWNTFDTIFITGFYTTICTLQDRKCSPQHKEERSLPPFNNTTLTVAGVCAVVTYTECKIECA